MGDTANVLLETIEYAIDTKLSTANVDRTLVCKVKEVFPSPIGGCTATLTSGGSTYTVSLKNNVLSVMDTVHLKFPSGNEANKYVEEDLVTAGNGTGGGGGTVIAGVTSVNGKTGAVTITVNDIQGLSEMIRSGKQIINTEPYHNLPVQPEGQETGDIWYATMAKTVDMSADSTSTATTMLKIDEDVPTVFSKWADAYDYKKFDWGTKILGEDKEETEEPKE